MYVVAPALPAPYKWLQVPLSALHTDRWPGYFANEKQQNLETAKILLGMLGMEPATVDIDPMAQ